VGVLTESAVLNQLKKAQGETNERLEQLIVLLEKQTRLLEESISRRGPVR
jgi:hypothetical protein